MNPCVLIILSLLFLLLVTTTASQLVAVGGDANGVIHKCLGTERHALLDFKASLQDPDNTLSTWAADEHDCCKWSGVTCSNKTGHVTELNVAGRRLKGEISLSLVNLTNLNRLNLLYNSFHGNIPPFIGSLSQLSYISLGYNGFNGTIPRSIGSLTQLTFLDLSKNSLYGAIPPELGNLTNLQVLWLGDVGSCKVMNTGWLSHLSHLKELIMDGISLAKANHWVDEISSLQSLSSLSLDRCELARVVYPYSSFFNSSSSIKVLSFRNNSLTSSMYHWLFRLTNNKLRELDLSGNMLNGRPKYLGNLCGLESFYFNNNSAIVKFPGFLNNLSGCTSLALQKLYASKNQFTGSLSDDIQKFSSLEYLDLSDDHLNGSISEKLWELPKLETFDVSFNNLRVPYNNLSSLSYAKYIDLSSCKLGPLFPKWIQTLKNITRLDISKTGISDTTPLKFWYMWPSQLRYLNLSSNNISGEVPDLLSNFAKSSIIDLSSNNLSGQIPKVSSALGSLNLSKNKFTGGISFICQIVDGFLSYLDLSHNSLIGQLPDCLWHFKQLKVLNLGHNNLFGRLPPSVGSLVQLQVLHLYKNDFFGELPLSLKNCTSIISLNLGSNKFFGNVPVWIGENLSGLYILILRSNNFFGTIPLQLCQLENLQILDLSVNNLHGTIPSCISNFTSMVQPVFSNDVQFGTILRNGYIYAPGTYVDNAIIKWQGDEREFFGTLKLLKSIDLSSNNLTGQIPYEITNLYDLIALNLSMNALFGDIPWNIGEMKNLLTLDLSRNNFFGRIPSSMSKMTLLNYLDVSLNNLSGRIPSSTQLQSFDASRYDGNARLCGPPLTKKCPGDEESEVPKTVLDKSKGDGDDIDELWGWFYIGVGSGFGTGFWIACGALLVNRRGRQFFFHFFDSFQNWVHYKIAKG